MQNFLAPKENFTDTVVALSGDEYFHATRSCRVRVGESIGVTDGCGRRVEARIMEIDRNTLRAEITSDVSGQGEPAVEINVALALIKSARFELAVEKCTELGVRRFVPLVTGRCTVKPERVNLERLRKIALEAAKQSGRSRVPEITEPVNLMELYESVHGTVVLATASAELSMDDAVMRILESGQVTLVIGPEGDFTDEERDVLITGGAVPVAIGGLTLRSETAAIAAAALCCKCSRKSWKDIFLH